MRAEKALEFFIYKPQMRPNLLGSIEVELLSKKQMKQAQNDKEFGLFREVLPDETIGASKLTEDYFERIIMKWQRNWMDVKGTDEKDRRSYFERSAGIDANMRYGLAKMLVVAMVEENN